MLLAALTASYGFNSLVNYQSYHENQKGGSLLAAVLAPLGYL